MTSAPPESSGRSSGVVRLPQVKTGGCSSSSTRSVPPATTSACSARCSSQAARYSTSPRGRCTRLTLRAYAEPGTQHRADVRIGEPEAGVEQLLRHGADRPEQLGSELA